MTDQYLSMTLDHMLAQAPGRDRRLASRAWSREIQRTLSQPEDKTGAK